MASNAKLYSVEKTSFGTPTSERQPKVIKNDLILGRSDQNFAKLNVNFLAFNSNLFKIYLTDLRSETSFQIS